MTILSNKINLETSFPNFNRKLRLGIIGGGRIAEMQSMAARMTNRWDIVAGALSSDPKKNILLSNKWFLNSERVYSSYKEMAISETKRQDCVDAVMITTPNHLHLDCCKEFIEAGISIMCDKPLTNTVSDAQQLKAHLKDFKGTFGVGYVMSCFPMVRQAKELISLGEIGAINQIHVEFFQDWMVTSELSDEPHVKWRLDPAKSGNTSCVGDIGTHACHLAQFVSGLSLTELRADFHVCGHPKKLEDTAFMSLKFENGIPGTLMVTRVASGNRGGLRLRIYGSKGGIEWDLEKCDFLRLNLHGKPDQVISRGHGHGISKTTQRLIRSSRGFPEGIIEAWGNLYTELAIAIAAQKDETALPDHLLQFPDFEEGFNGVKFNQAAYTSSINNGKWISIE